uniref:Uncharacterized protein n=1 Tax=Anguilla anguilla TaxID=7936 RepID=A0A0E9TS50_ANGAN
MNENTTVTNTERPCTKHSTAGYFISAIAEKGFILFNC